MMTAVRGQMSMLTLAWDWADDSLPLRWLILWHKHSLLLDIHGMLMYGKQINKFY